MRESRLLARLLTHELNCPIDATHSRRTRLRAVEWSTHSDALDDGRPGKPELNRHERARRYSRDRAVADCRVIGLARLTLRQAGRACGREGEPADPGDRFALHDPTLLGRSDISLGEAAIMCQC